MAEKKNIKSAKTDTKQTKKVEQTKIDAKSEIVEKPIKDPAPVEQSKEIKVSQNKVRKPLYFGFVFRFVFLIILFILLVATSAYSLTKAVLFENEKIVSYTEKGNLDYNICLLDNDFYEQKCIKKDMKYVASLIDKVKVNFDYQFKIDENVNMNFNYNVKARLVISDPNSGKLFYEKDYMLIPPKTAKIENNKEIKINEVLDIDYNYYNTIANQFRNNYGVDPESKLLIYMNINKSNSIDEKAFAINKNSIMNMSIPLSEKSIEIELDHTDVDSSNSVILNENDLFIKNVVYSCITVIATILTLLTTVKLIRSIKAISGKSSPYDKYIKKILKEYDRLIAESSNMISFEEKEIIKFNKFSELLDIHDNLGLPIMHYTITPHVKSYFYIVHDNIVYLYIVKAIDLEKKKHK